MTVKYRLSPYQEYPDGPPNDINDQTTDEEIEMALKMPKIGTPIMYSKAYFMRLDICISTCIGIDEDGTKMYDFSPVNIPLPIWAAKHGFHIEFGEKELNF